MPTADPTQVTPALLDQDQSRAALGVITYLMTHTLPPSRMQSQAQPNHDGQQEQPQQKPQEPQQAPPQEAPQQPQPDPTAELKGQMDSMKIEHDAKLKSIVEHQQQEIDQLKQMIEQALSEDEPTQTA